MWITASWLHQLKNGLCVTLTFLALTLTEVARAQMSSGSNTAPADSTVQTTVIRGTRAELERNGSTIQGAVQRYQSERDQFKSELKKREKRRTAAYLDSLQALNCGCVEVARDAVRATFAWKWHRKSVRMLGKLTGRILEQRRKLLQSPVAKYLKSNGEAVLQDGTAMKEVQQEISELERFLKKLAEKSKGQKKSQITPNGLPGKREDWTVSDGIENRIDSVRAALEGARHELDMLRSQRQLDTAVRSVAVDVFIRSRKLFADARNRWAQVIDHYKKWRRHKKQSLRERRLLKTKVQDVEGGGDDPFDVTDDDDAEPYP